MLVKSNWNFLFFIDHVWILRWAYNINIALLLLLLFIFKLYLRLFVEISATFYELEVFAIFYRNLITLGHMTVKNSIISGYKKIGQQSVKVIGIELWLKKWLKNWQIFLLKKISSFNWVMQNGYVRAFCLVGEKLIQKLAKIIL